MKRLLLILSIAGLMAGCYYDNEEQLYPTLNQSCDTTGVAFAKSILPILQTNCYGCHSSSQAAAFGAGYDIENFVTLKQIVASGRFYGAIIHDPSRSPMPMGGVKLDTCTISKIKIWIDHGAPDN